MSDIAEPGRVQRVLVALDAASFGIAALEAAVQLAAELHAELHGLFVEDIDLLRLAALPFAQEIAASSAKARRMELPAIESLLRAKVAERQSLLAVAAQNVGIQSSFRVVRGRVVESTLAAAAEADLLVLWQTEGRPLRLRPTQPIIALLAGDASDRQSLQLAAQLVASSGDRLVVLLGRQEPEDAAALRGEVNRLAGQFGLQVAHLEAMSCDPDTIIAAVHRHRGKLLLINSQNGALTKITIESLVRKLSCPVVLVHSFSFSRAR